MIQRRKNKVWETVEAIITALILALIIRAYVVQAFKIPSGSMKPTLLVGDHILVLKFIYGTKIPFTDKRILVFTEPKRGDVIVFKYPKDPDRDFIKRVIGVGGDVVEERNKVIYVNGKPLKEPYVQHTDTDIRPAGYDVRDNFGPITVPEGKLFVMGDNRDQSYDSRYWGFVDLKDVKGKAVIIYWSWDPIKHRPRLGRIGKLIH
jgi:signal peptidase I